MNITVSNFEIIEDRRSDWASIAAVIVGIAAFAMAQGLTYPLISLLLASRGTNETLIGLNAAAYMVGLAVSTVVMPWMTARFRAGALVVASLIGSAVTLVMMALMDNLTAWFIFRFCLGFSVNTIYVIGEAWLNVAATDRVRGRVAGLYGTSMAAGFALGPLGIPLFGTENGLAFAVCAVMIAFVAFLFAVLSRRALVEPDAMPHGALLPFLRTSPLLVAVILFYGIIDASVISIVPIYLAAEGMSANEAALFVTVVHIGIIVSQLPLGAVLDRFNRWTVAGACFAVASLTFALFTIVPINGWTIWFLAALCGSAFFGVYTAGISLLGANHRGGDLVAGSAAFAMAYAAGGVIGTPLTGAALAWEPSSAMILLAVVGGIGALMILSKRRRAT